MDFELPVLETERLILKKVMQEDLKDIFSYGSIEEVTKYVTWNTHRTLADSQVFVNFALNQFEQKKIAPWGIEYKDTGKIIGSIDFVSWQQHHKVAEIGYVLSPNYWGKGIITEAAKRIIQYGFEEMDLVRFQARCFVQNIGSARVMEKAGMSFEGIMKKAMFIKEKHWDLKMYAILKEEFLIKA
ncbi:GNAT family protein [Bacillus salipaludis]|uniref:GNAT family N-acetyltransferase n=1 Tax=Bacillus salipaludis TaxID=2547811 RepID=UPI002E20E765|nr:GNAT family protein [Bacillus salipaludis]